MSKDTKKYRAVCGHVADGDEFAIVTNVPCTEDEAVDQFIRELKESYYSPADVDDGDVEITNVFYSDSKIT